MARQNLLLARSPVLENTLPGKPRRLCAPQRMTFGRYERMYPDAHPPRRPRRAERSKHTSTTSTIIIMTVRPTGLVLAEAD
jgi:hypothetical protein